MKSFIILSLILLSFPCFAQKEMKIIRVKYILASQLKTDFQRAFPDWDGTKEDISDAVGNRHVRIKVYRDPITGARTHAIVYMLVRQSFTLPQWVQGELLLDDDPINPIDHYFMGHEPEIN